MATWTRYFEDFIPFDETAPIDISQAVLTGNVLAQGNSWVFSSGDTNPDGIVNVNLNTIAGVEYTFSFTLNKIGSCPGGTPALSIKIGNLSSNYNIFNVTNNFSVGFNAIETNTLLTITDMTINTVSCDAVVILNSLKLTGGPGYYYNYFQRVYEVNNTGFSHVDTTLQGLPYISQGSINSLGD